MAIHLSEKRCVACEGGDPALTSLEVKNYMGQVNGWQNADDKKIKKEFVFSAEGGSAPGGKDSPFKQAMAFVNKVADIAESEGHHPDIYIFYNKVTIELYTHAVNGLSENDFILAAKIDKITG